MDTDLACAPTSEPSRPQTRGPEPAALYSTDSYVPEESVGYLIKKLYHSTVRHMDAQMQAHELTAMQWGPLLLLSHGKGDTAAALAREANIDTGAMTRMVDRLEAKGLIRRVRSAHDRRVVHLELTDEGRRVVTLIPQGICRVLNLHLAGFRREELEQLKSLLRRMIVNGQQATASPTAS